MQLCSNLSVQSFFKNKNKKIHFNLFFTISEFKTVKKYSSVNFLMILVKKVVPWCSR